MIPTPRSVHVRANLKGYVSGAILVLVLVSAAFATQLAPFDPYAQSLADIGQAPFSRAADGGVYLLGTDQLGRDVLTRLLYGGRLSLIMGISAVLISGVVGVILGVIAGYFRGVVDTVVMRLSDMQLSIPTMLLAILIVAVLGSSLWNTIMVLALTGWVPFARVVRSEVLTLREREFVSAARAMGVSAPRNIAVHIMPNISFTLITQATLQLAHMILLAASMSFLGLGVDVSAPTWGGMINDGRGTEFWWLMVFPGLAIALVILCINVFGEWLQEKLQ